MSFYLFGSQMLFLTEIRHKMFASPYQHNIYIINNNIRQHIMNDYVSDDDDDALDSVCFGPYPSLY